MAGICHPTPGSVRELHAKAQREDLALLPDLAGKREGKPIQAKEFKNIDRKEHRFLNISYLCSFLFVLKNYRQLFVDIGTVWAFTN